MSRHIIYHLLVARAAFIMTNHLYFTNADFVLVSMVADEVA